MCSSDLSGDGSDRAGFIELIPHELANSRERPVTHRTIKSLQRVIRRWKLRDNVNDERRLKRLLNRHVASVSHISSSIKWVFWITLLQ